MAEPGGARVPADPERLAEAEAFTRGAVEYDATGALALFVAEYDRRGSEIERLRGLWPTNGLGEETNVHQLVANHRAWSKRAWEAQSAAETERDALRADVERLRARTHEIQAQEMAKRADPGSEALGALNVSSLRMVPHRPPRPRDRDRRSGVTRRWVIGDKHDCPRHDSRHVAVRGCAEYAMEHGDQTYAGTPAPVDLVNHPRHYTSSPSGVECIQVTEHLGFCIGNAIKYLWRADAKGAPLEDLRKARWYVDREIARRERLAGLPRRDADGRTEVEA